MAQSYANADRQYKPNPSTTRNRLVKIPSANKVPPAVREALKGILVDLDNGDIDGARARLKNIIA